MGIIVQAQCPECHYKQEFFLGAGMLDNNIELVIKRFSVEERSNIRLWIAEHKLKSFKANILLTFCNKCNTYNATPVLEMQSTTGTIGNFGFQCSECGETLIMVQPFSKSEGNPCSLCGKKLNFLEVGNWD